MTTIRLMVAAAASAVLFGAVSFAAVSTEKGKEGSMMEKEQTAVTRTVEFENDRVVAVRFHFAPHAKIPMHAAPALVAVWLTDARLKLTFPDGTSRIEDRRTGDVEWEPAQRHSGENLGDRPLDFIAVQLKDGK